MSGSKSPWEQPSEPAWDSSSKAVGRPTTGSSIPGDLQEPVREGLYTAASPAATFGTSIFAGATVTASDLAGAGLIAVTADATNAAVSGEDYTVDRGAKAFLFNALTAGIFHRAGAPARGQSRPPRQVTENASRASGAEAPSHKGGGPGKEQSFGQTPPRKARTRPSNAGADGKTRRATRHTQLIRRTHRASRSSSGSLTGRPHRRPEEQSYRLPTSSCVPICETRRIAMTLPSGSRPGIGASATGTGRNIRLP